MYKIFGVKKMTATTVHSSGGDKQESFLWKVLGSYFGVDHTLLLPDRTLAFMVLVVRFSMICFCILSNLLVLDHEAEGVESLAVSFSSPLSQTVLQPFLRWDSIHYLHIALDGYKKDYQYVFYPLLPHCLRWLGNAASCLQLQRFEAMTGMAVFCLHPLLQVISALILKRILIHFGYSIATVNRACYYFVFNPAAVFFLSLYTESCYAVFSWTAFYLLQLFPSLPYAAFPLLLASLTRSNGIFNIVVVSVMFLRDAAQHVQTKSWRKLCACFVTTCLCLLACALPYFWFNQFAYHSICNGDMSMQHHDLCSTVAVWSTYAYLQHQFWGVGLLQYYQWRQLPNFIVAFPSLYFMSLYLFSEFKRGTSLLLSKWSGLLLHLLLLTAVVLTMAHVQIIHRTLLSSSPLTYLILAQVAERKLSRYVDVYVFGYMILGMVLHCNFYPWT